MNKDNILTIAQTQEIDGQSIYFYVDEKIFKNQYEEFSLKEVLYLIAENYNFYTFIGIEELHKAIKILHNTEIIKVKQ